MKIGVLGSGNGATAVAFDFAKFNNDVYIFDFEEFSDNIKSISDNKGIYAEGELKGFAPIKYAGHDIEKVVKGADIIFAVGPAYSTKPFAETCRPYLKKGQIVIICPGSCGGALVFKNTLGLDLQNEEIIIAETNTLPYAVRLVELGKVRVFLKLKGGLFLSALPSRYAQKIIDLIKGIYPCILLAKNVFQTMMQNGNPIIHPAVTLLNAALIERTKGNFFFYEEGITPSVGRLIKAADEERIKIGKKLGLDIFPDPKVGVRQGYMQEASYDKGYSKAKGFEGIKAQASINHRYINEDVGFGLIFMSDLGKRVGVSTPVMDSIITIASKINNRDYRKEKARTLENMGLHNYTIEQLGNIL